MIYPFQKKLYRNEELADIFLNELKKQSKPLALNDVLERKGLYYTPEIMLYILTLLEKRKKLIKEEVGVSISGHTNSSIEDIMKGNEVRGISHMYSLTSNGIYFLSKGQKIDRDYILKEKERRKEKLLGFAIGLTVGIILTLFSWWLSSSN